ncbi:MAG: DNA-binding protein [Bacteroides sp.]|nr:DNA-binding protein [Bacteroides sp.]
MSIEYEFYRNPNSEGTNKKRYHARVISGNRISSDQIAKEIQRESSLTIADVKAVLITLGTKLAQHLGEGNKVHLEGIGSFQVNLQCKEEVRTPHAIRSENVEFKSISYRADNELKKHLKKQKIVRSKNKPHSMPMTDEAIDQILTEYFATNETLTRRQFQFHGMQVKSTALRILKKLVEEGKLKNVSTRQNPVYMPDNGHYATVAEK